ncbi:MAG: bifunctional UDP-N-acetylglucosamine diphosphorylase/glucosamine-1-phosphate N-acetyltransferase GlmU [Myxococcota bacterium]|nr:bifunctional UDP-N-acetylglucosamine diphosphorylase/glucosamine-1-phosphate N-acetyltransferase GlmU [Myxococcota bacterium]
MSDATKPLAVLVLAAGQGTRMKSGLAKVLHPLGGRPMLHHVLAAAEALQPERLVTVVGRDADAVCEAFAGRSQFVLQEQRRGTGHAVLQTESALEGFSGDVLVLYGDTPLLTAETLRRLQEHKRATQADLVLLSAAVDVPGIVLRDASGALAGVVEATDASPEELGIEERNTGVYLVDRDVLWKSLAQVGQDNAQGEVYLTTVVEILLREGRQVEVLRIEDDDEGIGINDRVDLARAEAALRTRTLNRLMREGVTIVDPANTAVDVDVSVGRDTRIEPGSVIQGATRIGERCHVKPGCVIEESVLGDDVVVGPSAHLRPGCALGDGVRIGNFVEVKNANLGAGVKADHLSYIGDADVGDGASFGCGAITVNYDWKKKHRTTVGAGAVVGCNANLVAPVRVGRNASIAAGSTITKDVPDGSLAVARARGQKHVDGWSRRKRPEEKLD